jgi:hypothetical protein
VRERFLDYLESSQKAGICLPSFESFQHSSMQAVLRESLYAVAVQLLVKRCCLENFYSFPSEERPNCNGHSSQEMIEEVPARQ